MAIRNLACACTVAFSFGLGFPVTSLAEPTLTVMFHDGNSDVVLSDEELSALPQVSVTTGTPWTDEPMVYEGPTLWSVLGKMDAIGSDVELVALNDYKVRVTTDRITEDWPIVARLQNGETMSVRDKGPYWLMFPFDDVKELQTETFYALSIWQLVTIQTVE